VINGGGSYVKFSAGGIEHGTNGTFVAHAASHDFVTAKSMSAPDLKGDVVDVAVKRDLHLEYVDADGNPLQHDPIQAHAWDGQKHDSTLDSAGKTILANVSRGSFRAEQIKRK
jgi:type VI secretion system secreted protein VgrG